MSLREKLGASIVHMLVQRALDFVSVVLVTMLVVRSLSRQEYGVLSVVLSYGLLFNVLNVSVGAVLLRDLPKVRARVAEYLDAFVWFALAKALVVLVLSAGIGVYLFRVHRSPAMLAVLAVNALTTGVLMLTEPFTTALSADFRQPWLTRVNAVSSAVNVALSAGALLVPTALFVSLKNAAVAVVGLALTAAYARRAFPARPRPSARERVRLVTESFAGFSAWSHLIGIVTDAIYRADLLILGWLGAPLRTVGNYNIALQASNFTKLLPQILQYNATLGLSHTDVPRRRDELTFLFVKYSFLLSAATMAAYVLFGRLALAVLAGRDVDEIYDLGLYIIGGLCVYGTFRPLVSYATIVDDIRGCFLWAILPSGVATVAAYVIMGLLWGAPGLARANLVGGLLMTLFTLVHVHTRTSFTWRVELVTETERALLARWRTKPAS